MEAKVGLITGCSSGIGYASLAPLLSRGDIVYATLRQLSSRREIFADLKQQFPDRLRLLELDVGSLEQRTSCIETIREKESRLDYLINNAGYGIFGPFEDTPESEIRQQFESNFFGAVALTQLALPLLRQQKGRILVISSILGSVPLPFTSFYSGSKFALEGAFESLSHELRPHGVQVGLILPGGHRTSFDSNRKNSTAVNSVYTKESELFLSIMKASLDDHRAPPEHVVRAILRLLEKKSLPLRTFVGRDSQAIHVLHSLLPQSIFQPLVRAGIRFSSNSFVARLRGR